MVSSQVNGTGKILIVEDDADYASILKKRLVGARKGELDCDSVQSLAGALKKLKPGRFDLVLLDLLLPDSGGIDTYLKVQKKVPEVPVVILTGTDDEETAIRAMQGGAQEYLIKGRFSPELLPRTLRFAIERGRILRQLKKAWRIEKYQATHDPLTQLPNRFLLEDRLRQAIALARRQQQPLGVLFLDVDRFKEINDTLGHATGDLLLQKMAKRMRGCLREEDTVARLGGDEFVVVLYGVGLPEARRIASRILQEVSRPCRLEGDRMKISVSIGISLYPADGVDPDMLIQKADLAMYLAKEQGRNTVASYDALAGLLHEQGSFPRA